MDYPPGFSLLDFGVAGAHRPANAFICQVNHQVGPRFWSEDDLSLPGVISCTPVTLAQWQLISLRLTKALLRLFVLAREL